MKIDAIGIAKFVASGVVGLGTSKIVGRIIKNNVPAPETLIEKVTIAAAAWVIGSMAADKTRDHTNKMIDDGVKSAKKVAKYWKETSALARVNNDEVSFEESGLDPEKFEKNLEGRWVRKTTEEPAEDEATTS